MMHYIDDVFSINSGTSHGVVRGLIDIVVMSTNWTPMLARASSILSCASMRLGCQVHADWHVQWFVNFPIIKLGKSRYRLYWSSGINNNLIFKKWYIPWSPSPTHYIYIMPLNKWGFGVLLCINTHFITTCRSNMVRSWRNLMYR